VSESPDVLLDLNNPVLQDDLLGLSKEDAVRILAALREIKKLQWSQIYGDKGLHWELVQSKTGHKGERLYTTTAGSVPQGQKEQKAQGGVRPAPAI
jgi:hypothetical protein